MTRPRPWKSGGAGAPGEALELLRHARPTRAMSREDKARSAARLQVLVSASTATGLWLWVKGIAWGAGLGVATVAVVQGAVVLRAQMSSTVPSLPPSSSQALVRDARVVPAAPASVPPGPVEPGSESAGLPSKNAASRNYGGAPVQASGVASTAPTPEDSLAREARLLESARMKLQSDPSAALAKLREHATEFPQGKLAMERSLLSVDALRRSGRLPEARAAARSLLERSRGSLYENRIRKLLSTLE